jgi:hypothetical protein
MRYENADADDTADCCNYLDHRDDPLRYAGATACRAEQSKHIYRAQTLGAEADNFRQYQHRNGGWLSGRSPDSNATGGDEFRLWQNRQFAKASLRDQSFAAMLPSFAGRDGSPPFF